MSLNAFAYARVTPKIRSSDIYILIKNQKNELEQKKEQNRNLQRIIETKNNELKENNQQIINLKRIITEKDNELEQKNKTIKNINGKRGIIFNEIFTLLEELKITDPINIDLTEKNLQILNSFLNDELPKFENTENEKNRSLEDLISLKNEIQEIYQKLQKNYNQQLKINPMIFEQNLIRLFKLKQSKPNSKKVVCNEKNNLNRNENEMEKEKEKEMKGKLKEIEKENENDLENLISEKTKLLEKYPEYLEKIQLKLGNYNQIFFNFEEIKNNLFEEINKHLKINYQIIEGTYNNENVLNFIKKLKILKKKKMKEFFKKRKSISNLIYLFSNDIIDQNIMSGSYDLNKISEKYQKEYVTKVNEIEELKIYIKKILIIRQKLINLNETLIQFNQIKEKLNIINLSIQPLIKDFNNNNNKSDNEIKGIEKNYKKKFQKIQNKKEEISQEEKGLEVARDISNNEEQIEKIENSIEKLKKNKKKLTKQKNQIYEELILTVFRYFPEQIKKKNISLYQFSKENKDILLKKLQTNVNFKLILTKDFQDINSEKNTIGCSFKIKYNFQNNPSMENSKFHFYLTKVNLNSNTDTNNLKKIKKFDLSVLNDDNNKKYKTINIKKKQLDVGNYYCFFYFYDKILIGKTVIFKFLNKKINFIYDLDQNNEINWKSDSNDKIFQIIYNKKINTSVPREVSNSNQK
ncbi:chromatin assembly factor 1 subunit a caf-1 subunit a [Anaeramoeba flamelloides]|uniref:Chromatin assembly factor 1 subunit a caf-1 subunit a n=1 Tax=Anaeramoeba flamelloides TaxID=1746091 RepID=A0ABQ8YJ98_9EUKA|nr:chromatin assembly factor 1 subunit a caf-1 subunit a [Anaeramoeba flamelloides]